jgi:hypothetical protein
LYVIVRIPGNPDVYRLPADRDHFTPSELNDIGASSRSTLLDKYPEDIPSTSLPA